MNQIVKDKVMEHAASSYPEECVGFFVWTVTGLEVVKANNISDTKTENFKINPVDYINAKKLGKIVGIYHSHPDHSSVITLQDIVVATEYCVPIYAFSYPKYEYHAYIPDNFQCELIGRPFAENIFDCLSLVRDYNKQKFNINFPFFAYETDWMEQGKTHFEDMYESFGFIKVTEPKPSDTVLFKLGMKFVCHAAILEDYNTLLHHCEDRLSCREAFDYRLVKHVYGYFRHKSLI